jgi:hypothetical protein
VIEQIKKRLDNGFAPFALRLSDGRRFAVPHRDFIAVSPKVVVVIGEDQLAVSISPLQIVSIDDLAPGRQRVYLGGSCTDSTKPVLAMLIPTLLRKPSTRRRNLDGRGTHRRETVPPRNDSRGICEA